MSKQFWWQSPPQKDGAHGSAPPALAPDSAGVDQGPAMAADKKSVKFAGAGLADAVSDKSLQQLGGAAAAAPAAATRTKGPQTAGPSKQSERSVH